MSPFWTSVFADLRERGRNGTLFIVAVVLLFVLLVIASQIPHEVYVNYVMPVLPWAVGLVAIGFIRGFLKARARRRERFQHSPMSCDELNKARNKLVKSGGAPRRR